jgi:hypothetical protein
MLLLLRLSRLGLLGAPLLLRLSRLGLLGAHHSLRPPLAREHSR